jgi:hypothetical protein
VILWEKKKEDKFGWDIHFSKKGRNLTTKNAGSKATIFWNQKITRRSFNRHKY